MIKKNLTKKDLSKKINQNLGFSKNFSLNLVDNFFNTIISELKKTDKIKLSSFGTFLIKNKKERIGRNPKNKVEAKIHARKVIKFKPSLLLKSKLKNKL